MSRLNTNGSRNQPEVEIEEERGFEKGHQPPVRIPSAGVIGQCSMCKRDIRVEDLPDDPKMRMYHARWKIHVQCLEFVHKKLDLEAR